MYIVYIVTLGLTGNFLKSSCQNKCEVFNGYSKDIEASLVKSNLKLKNIDTSSSKLEISYKSYKTLKNLIFEYFCS